MREGFRFGVGFTLGRAAVHLALVAYLFGFLGLLMILGYLAHLAH